MFIIQCLGLLICKNNIGKIIIKQVTNYRMKYNSKHLRNVLYVFATLSSFKNQNQITSMLSGVAANFQKVLFSFD